MATITMPGMLLSGTHAARPAANAVGGGTLYAETDTGQTYQSDGASTWTAWGAAAGSGAMPTVSSAQITTSETTASATYTDLATPGPAVTVTVPASGKVRVTIGAEQTNSASGFCITSFALSGANTVAAGATAYMVLYASAVSQGYDISRTTVLTGLSAGSTTFTMKYKSSAGTGTWDAREIIVEAVS